MPVHHVELLARGLVGLHGAPEAPVGYDAPEGVVVGLLHHRPVLTGNGADVADVVEGVVMVNGHLVALPDFGVATGEEDAREPAVLNDQWPTVVGGVAVKHHVGRQFHRRAHRDGHAVNRRGVDGAQFRAVGGVDPLREAAVGELRPYGVVEVVIAYRGYPARGVGGHVAAGVVGEGSALGVEVAGPFARYRQGVVGHRLHAVAVEGDVEVVNLAVDAILLQAVTLEALHGPVGRVVEDLLRVAVGIG